MTERWDWSICIPRRNTATTYLGEVDDLVVVPMRFALELGVFAHRSGAGTEPCSARRTEVLRMLDGTNHFGRGAWFEDERLGGAVGSLCLPLLFRQRCHCHSNNRGVHFLNLGEDCKTVDRTHCELADDGVEVVLLNEPEALASIGGRLDAPAGPAILDQLLDGRESVRILVDDQDRLGGMARHGPLLTCSFVTGEGITEHWDLYRFFGRKSQENFLSQMSSFGPVTSLSVIIAAGSVDDTVSCLKSAIDFADGFEEVEFLAVDRGENSATTATLRQLASSDLRVVPVPNTTWPDAWLTGVHTSRGEFNLLLSADVRLVPNCVRVLTSILEQFPERDLVGPAIASGAASVPSKLFDFGDRLCLLARRSSLITGQMSLGYVPHAFATAGSVD